MEKRLRARYVRFDQLVRNSDVLSIHAPHRKETDKIIDMKVFRKIEQHAPDNSFNAWLRSVMVHTAIDYYRKEVKHYNHQQVEETTIQENSQADVIDRLSYIELIEMIQQLSPAYRAVFNLYVIDGYTHQEIAKLLHISEGTSKSNLLKARAVLRKMIEKVNNNNYSTRYV